MNEWIKYDGTNPPTDRTKDVRWRIDFGHGSYVTHYAGAMGIAPAGAIAWQYLDPYPVEPEMPDVVWISGWNLPDGEGHWVREEIIHGSGRNRYRRCVEITPVLLGHVESVLCDRTCGKCSAQMMMADHFCPRCGAEVKR